MPTGGTETVNLQLVGLNGEPVFAGHFFLEFLNITVFKFHDLPTGGAYDVVVVPFMRDIIVLGLGAEVAGLC